MLKKLFDKTTLKFILVGIVNTLFGTTVMFVAYNVLHCGYWFSSAANYVLGSILSYFLNKYFTFRSKKRSWKEIIVFAVNVAVCYLLAYGIAQPAATALLSGAGETLRDNVAMVVGMGLYVGLNYLGQRFIVFRGGEDA